MKRLARELALMGCEVVTGAEPHLADSVALDTPGCVAGVDEALAIIREYHGQWARDRASKGAADGAGEATRRRQP